MSITNNLESKLRKNDSKYINKLLIEVEANSNELFEIINSCNSNTLTEENISLALQKGYFIRNNTPEYIKSNSNIIKTIIENTDIKLKIKSTINNCKESSLTESIIMIAINKGYTLSNLSPNIIKNNPKYILELLKLSNSGFEVKGIIDNCMEGGLSKEVLILALEKGYYFDQDTNHFIRTNPNKLNIVLNHIKDKYELTKLINLCSKESLTEENISLAVQKGYYIDSTSSDIIKNSKEISYNIIKYLNNLIQIESTLENIDETCLTEELINLIIQKKYQINITTPDKIKNNPQIIKIILNSTTDKEEIKRIIDTVSSKVLTEDIINLAIEKGYYLNDKTKDIIKQNPQYISKLLEVNKTSLEIRNTILSSDSNYLTKEIITLALAKGFYYKKEDREIPGIPYNLDYQTNPNILKELLNKFKDKESIIDIILNCDTKGLTEEILNDIISKYSIINFKTIEKLNELTKPYLDQKLSNIDSEYRNKLIHYQELLGSASIYFYKDNDLFSKEVIDLLPETTILKIYKYIYLIEKQENIRKIIKNNQFKSFITFYTDILDKSLDKFDVLYFNEVAEKYLKYQDLIKDIKDDQDKSSLKNLFEINYPNIKINSLEEVKNLSSHIFISNKNILDTVSNIEEIKDIIYLLLCNKPYKDIKRTLEEIIDSNKIENLYQSLKDNKIKELLQEYKITISFLGYIMNSNNLEELKELGHTLNNMYLNDNNKFNSLFSLLKDLEPTMKKIYSIEANQELTKINNLQEADNITIERNKYGENIDYIDIKGEYYFLIHAMNAFGSSSKITDWKNHKLACKTFISLSSISQEKIGVQRIPKDINSVTVIFDNIYLTSLIKMAEKDVFSYGVTYNNLSIDSKYCNFNTLKETLKQTPTYNEYVLYRENDDGSYIYPSAILVTGDNPVQAEIDAAKYLEVPLVKTHPKVEMKTNISSINKKEEAQNLISLKEKLEELIKLQNEKITSPKTR